jgi:hypothetical protein
MVENFCVRGCPAAVDCEIASQLITQADYLKNGPLPKTKGTAMQYATGAEAVIKTECAVPHMAEPALDHYRNTAASLK